MEITLAVALALAVYLAVAARRRQRRAQAASAEIGLQLADHRSALQLLRAEQTRARAILDTTLDAVVAMDHEGRIVEFNLCAEKTFGYRRRDVVGRQLADVLVPESLREQHRRGLARYLATGEATLLGQRLEMMALRSDASLVPIELNINRLPGDGPATFAAFLRDLTERKQVERVSHEGQQLLHAIIDNSMAVIYVKDLAGRYLLVNRRYEEIFRRSRASILGKTDYDLFPKEAADTFRAMDERVARANGNLIEEESVPEVDGLHVYISVKSPLRDPAGKTYAVFGVSTDITERTRAEEQLRRHSQTLELLQGVSGKLLAELELENIVQAVTDASCQISGAAFGAFFYNEKNELGESYTLYTLSGAPREAFAAFPTPRATALFGPTFQGQGVVRIADVLQDPRYGKNAPSRRLVHSVVLEPRDQSRSGERSQAGG